MSNIRKVFNNGEKVELPIWNGKTPYALYYNGECVWKNGKDKPKHFIVTVWNVTNETFTFPALTINSYGKNIEEVVGIIDWGDGNEEEYNSTIPIEHNYNKTGIYTITIYVDITVIAYTKLNGEYPTSFEKRKDLLSIDTEKSILKNCWAYTFYGCSNLYNAKFNDSLSFANNTFTECTSLTEITLPKATNVTDGMFAKCDSLTSVTITKYSFPLGDYSFQSCKNLKSLNLENCYTLGEYCIYDSGIQEIKLSSKYAKDDYDYWLDFGMMVVQNKFLNILFDGYNRHFTIIDNCVYWRNTPSEDYTYFVYCLNTSSGDIKIKNGTTRLCKYAFKDGNSDGKNSYTKSHYLNGITSITIPKSVTQIDNDVFESYSSFYYGGGTFYSNNQVVQFYYEGTSEEWSKIVPSYRYFPTGNPLICLGDE